MTPDVHDRALREVIQPTLDGMAADGLPYTGFLYAGLMVAPNGSLKVLEFNCRFGDPETQPIMMRLKSDLPALCLEALAGRLDQAETDWDPRPALGVVLAAEGYPNEIRTGDAIEGLPETEDLEVKVFHAGTKPEGDRVLTSGGRVLCVSALGSNVKDAQQKAYARAREIQWPGVTLRNDIGYRAIARET